MGIKAGLAQVVLEDCSGKKYTLPEVTLSDEIVGGSEETGGEGYTPIWKGDVYIYDWANWQYLTSDQLSLEGFQIQEGLMIRLTFDNPDGASVCVCDGNWGHPMLTAKAITPCGLLQVLPNSNFPYRRVWQKL